MQLIHRLGSCIDLTWNDVTLFRYNYRPNVTGSESPKPYFHPIRTLTGNTVTLYRPHDHRWHCGLSMTCTDVSGHNFWGGPTFVRDKGYVQLDNVGRQEHTGWKALQTDGERAELLEELKWITVTDETVFAEERRMRVVNLDPERGYWTLEFHTRLDNVSGKTLEIGSPTTNGRPNAGYGGLFWRGPRSFTGGQVLGADGLEGQDAGMGSSGPWLAYIGRHDEADDASTLLFIDHPENPRYPTKWFVRSQPYGCISFSFMFDETYRLDAGKSLDLTYRIVIADGAWDRDQIERVVVEEQA